MKKLLSVLLVFAFIIALIPAGVFPASAAESDYDYEIQGTVAEIIRYSGPGGNVIIPDTLGGYPVTSITGYLYYYGEDGDFNYYGAFEGSAVISVTIPSSVNYIGEAAFSGCTMLTDIVLPHSLADIAERAFSGCTELMDIVIPPSVTGVANDAFSECPNLTIYCFEYSDAHFYALDNLLDYYLINGPGRILDGGIWDFEYNGVGVTITFYGGSGSNVVIPDNFYGYTVTAIADSVFMFHDEMKSLVIPESVTSIGSMAFYGCYILTIHCFEYSYAYYYAINKSITYVLITDTPIPDFTYEFNENGVTITKYNGTGTNVIIPDELDGHPVTAVTGYSYEQRHLTLDGEWYTNEYDGAFEEKAISSIAIPEGVTEIGDDAFRGCTALTAIVLPASVIDISSSALQNCPNLEIYCYENSAAHTYAITNSINYRLINIMAASSGPGCAIDYQNMFITDLPTGITTLDGYLDLADGCTLSYTPTANGFGTGSYVNVIKNGMSVESYQIVIPGDICGNGKITALDALMVLQESAGLITLNEAQQLAANVNGDASISSVDALIVLQYSAGLITAL